MLFTGENKRKKKEMINKTKIIIFVKVSNYI